MNRAELRELLSAVALGIATPQERAAVLEALQTDAELRREYRELEAVLAGVGATQPVTPPPALKTRLLDVARQESAPRASIPTTQRVPHAPTTAPRTSSHRVPRGRGLWSGVMLGGIVALAALVFTWLNPALPTVNASVVATTGDGGLIYASSGRSLTPAVLVRPDRSRVAVKFDPALDCVFTAAASSNGLAYLLDAKNSILFIVDETSGAVVDKWEVPAGAAGLAVQGDTVVVKGAISGTTAIFRKNAGGKTMLETRIAPSADMPMKEVMDATVINDNRVYSTHHATGEIAVLDASSGRELVRFTGLGKPVSLALSGASLLVLDYDGRLLTLNRDSGRIVSEVRLQGNPDRLTVMDDIAFLSDRDGFVTSVRIATLEVIGRELLEGVPMDLTPMADGHVAVAVSRRGVIVLDRNLKPLETL
jgi:outer membrane protein assembly factor BamB